MRRVFRVVTLIVLVGAAGTARAHAEPLGSDAVIGTFDWVDDILFGSGSTFSVNNESSSTFEAVSVELFASGGATPFQTLILGDIPSLGFAQSFEDLSSLLVGADVSEALLRLTYNSTPLTATLFAASLVGDPAALLAASIDLRAPAPVPEPSTLIVLSGGLAATAWRHRRERREKTTRAGRLPQPASSPN